MGIIKMNINMEKNIENFLKYTNKYDLNNDNIQRKQGHSLRVMKISGTIAKQLNLNEKDIKLASTIGLLHDIARFEQYKQYKTFDDSISFDHGDYALEILNKEIRNYLDNDEYDEIIKKSISNHNKYKIEDGLTRQEKLFAEIIRDADKIDILYESVELFWKGKEKEVEESTISKEVLEAIKSNETVVREVNKKLEKIDSVISIIAFVFDINFKASFEIIQHEDYINKILNRYNMKDKKVNQEIQEVRKIANRYIEKKLL